MRRIYDSRALDRADDDPYRPNERDVREKPRAARNVPVQALSDALVPTWLRYRAVSVSVSTPEPSYPPLTAVPITVTMKNTSPFPVTIRTRSPVVWTWHVDGYPEASHVQTAEPSRSGEFQFDRGERKRFTRRWDQLFRISDSEWVECAPGEYTVGAAINVPDAEENGLADETTVRIG